MLRVDIGTDSTRVSILEVIVLAVVQGLTEFLPISSSGHLALTRWLFGWEDPGLAFDVAVHAGTLLAIIWAFRREIIAVLRGLRLSAEDAARAPRVDGLPPRRLVALGFVATVPLAIIGAPLYEALESELRGPTSAAAFLLVTAALIALAEWRARRAGNESLAALTVPRAAAIGVAQALAALPGVSRAGMCIVAGVSLGHSREAAARFAFWLALPALTGAGALAVRAVLEEGGAAQIGQLALGAAVACVAALLAIRALLWLTRSRSLMPFAAWCLLAGGGSLIARAAGG